MQVSATIKHWLLLLFFLSITVCAPVGPAAAPLSVVKNAAAIQTQPTPPPTAAPTLTLPPSTQTPNLPTPPIPTLSPTENPNFLTALVWKDELQAPVILYHRFLPVGSSESSRTKMRLDEFQQQIESLYEAGYSLVSIEKWLAGDISLPVGRRPLILSMDDLFFADQIYIEADGEPSMRSGLGILWNFSQTHPEFGFSVALFYNLGDKFYGNKKTSTWFNVAEGWQDALASAIVWCIEHDAMPYNHTYQHSSLDELDALAIKDELWRNDLEIRRFLKRAKREDLIPRLQNYIGLPYGVWPATKGLTDYMLTYRNPEDKFVGAVFEAGYFYEKRFLPASFMPGFDRLHIPRITTNTHRSIEFLTNYRSQFPVTEQCTLGPVDPALTDDPSYITKQIQKALFFGRCHEGYYRVGRYFFEVKNGEQKLLWTLPANPN